MHCVVVERHEKSFESEGALGVTPSIVVLRRVARSLVVFSCARCGVAMASLVGSRAVSIASCCEVCRSGNDTVWTVPIWVVGILSGWGTEILEVCRHSA